MDNFLKHNHDVLMEICPHLDILDILNLHLALESNIDLNIINILLVKILEYCRDINKFSVTNNLEVIFNYHSECFHGNNNTNETNGNIMILGDDMFLEICKNLIMEDI